MDSSSRRVIFWVLLLSGCSSMSPRVSHLRTSISYVSLYPSSFILFLIFPRCTTTPTSKPSPPKAGFPPTQTKPASTMQTGNNGSKKTTPTQMKKTFAVSILLLRAFLDLSDADRAGCGDKGQGGAIRQMLFKLWVLRRLARRRRTSRLLSMRLLLRDWGILVWNWRMWISYRFE